MGNVLTNQSQLEFAICDGDDAVVISSNETIADEVSLTITKTQSCDYFVVGSRITYCVFVYNNSAVTLEALRWYDTLDSRLTYVVDSFTVEGEIEIPTESGQTLEWIIDELPASSGVEICFQVIVGE